MIKDELNLFNTSEANYISKQLDKISIDSLSAYTKQKQLEYRHQIGILNCNTVSI